MEWLIIPVMLSLGVLLLVWHVERSRAILERWAQANGYRLIHSERRYLRKGPFFWRSGKGHEVFYVTVEDQQGSTHHGYVRCGVAARDVLGPGDGGVGGLSILDAQASPWAAAREIARRRIVLFSYTLFRRSSRGVLACQALLLRGAVWAARGALPAPAEGK